tara:strand:+ start:312 stop:413 length:102 start_codon:yes stop_codon:yes gene_type:complete
VPLIVTIVLGINTTALDGVATRSAREQAKSMIA